MNIFKVLASGRKSFQEETASAILAWFLNPTMEHGLGYAFIQKFIDELSKTTNNKALSELSKKLVPRLRNEESQQSFWMAIEYNVEGAFIDMVFGIDDWVFAIENKIYSQSTTLGQLKKQYEGLRKKLVSEKIVMIYIVPIDENAEVIDPRSEIIFNELAVGANDLQAMLTWQNNATGKYSSIAKLISKTLDDEATGRIDPIAEYTRHTLKALNSFIVSSFAGYQYEKRKSSSGENPLTESRLKWDQLQKTDTGFVGVNYELKGLLRMHPGEIKNYAFQYTSESMVNKKNWIEVGKFNAVCNWLINRTQENIDWSGSFSSDLLYKIASDFRERVFVGIKGGESALRNMGADVIKDKAWTISTNRSNSQWIDGALYCAILQEKGLFQP